MSDHTSNGDPAIAGELPRLIAEHALDHAAFAVDREGLVTAWGPGAGRLFGYEEGEILGRSASILFTPEDVADDAPGREIREATAAGRSEAERRYVRKDGSRFRGGGVISRLLDGAGAIRGFALVVRVRGGDGQGRGADDPEDWNGADRFRNAFSHASIGMAVTDLEGRFLEVNPAYCRITGYTEEELRAVDFPSLTHPDDRPANLDQIRRLIEGIDAGFVVEKRYVRKGGAAVWVKVSVSSIRDDQGRPRRIVGLVEDITERKEAEDRLRASEERTRLLLDSAGEAIYGVDMDGLCTFCNPACLRMLGYDRAEDLIGRDLHTIIHHSHADGSSYPVHECRIYRAFRRGEGTHVDDEVFWRADGTSFPVEYRSHPIRKGGEPIGSVVTFTDISERKRAEATIAEQVRLAEYGRDVGRALTRGGTLEDMLRLCAKATVEHLGGAFARVWTADDPGDTLELRASAGLYTHIDGPHARVPIGRYKIGKIAQDRRPHLTNAVIGDPMVPAQDWARREGLVAFAGYPLVVEDRLVGVLAMFARRGLSEAALRMMGSVADEIAVGIERKRAEERLHRQREWLRVTLASIGDAVIATDVDGRVTFLNGVAEQLTAWTEADAAGRDLAEVFRIVNETTRREVESPAARALREGQIVGLANHTVLIARDGTERAVDDSAAPIRDEAGAVMGAVLIFRDVDERRRAERALEASEARKAAILDSAIDAIISIDHQGKVVEWNPAAERDFGYPRAEAIGREMAALIVPPSLREAHRRGMDRYLATGEGPVLGKRIAITAVRADGEEFPIELGITRIPGEGPPLFTAHVRDMTAQRIAQRRRDTRLAVTEALATAPTIREATARILQAIGDGLGWDLGVIWEVDADALRCAEIWHADAIDGGAFEADCRARTMAMGEGLPGRIWRAAEPCWVPDVTADDNFPRADSAARAGLRGAFGFPVRAGDEVLGVVEFFSGEVREPDPDLLEMMSTIGGQVGQFVERRRAEARLREQTRIAEALNRIGIVLAAELDTDRLLQFVTDEATRLTDARFGAFFRNAADDRGGPSAISGVALADFSRYRLPSPADLFGPEFRGDRSDEGRDPVGSLLAVPVVSRAGEMIGGLAFGHPEPGAFDEADRRLILGIAAQAAVAIDNARLYAELRTARDEAEAANRAKSQFLAVLSHELRTPLNPILLAASSMLERPADPEEFRPTLEMIRQNVHLQARLIDDLLDVMRIVRGKMPLQWEVADGHDLIRQALQMCRSEIFGKGLGLALDLKATGYFLNADPARFQQVIWNLVKNAVKFTPEGGAIALRTRDAAADGLVIEVTDSGIGIEPDVLPLIFDPFQQGETSITRKFGGLGLGLAICKGIVEAHGGTIEVESAGKGRGTTFRVTLKTVPSPATADPEPSAGQMPLDPPEVPSTRRILVVEDEPATLRLMARLLRGLGHEVTTAGTIAAGIEAFEAGSFDLIISDIGLPDGSGLELIRRAVALRGRIAAIALTGYGMEEDVQKSREAGFTAHMTKPIDFTKLEAVIAQMAYRP